MSINGGMDKQSVVHHTLEYYSALKRSEALTLATMWMNLENIIFSERSQTQETT